MRVGGNLPASGIVAVEVFSVGRPAGPGPTASRPWVILCSIEWPTPPRMIMSVPPAGGSSRPRRRSADTCVGSASWNDIPRTLTCGVSLARGRRVRRRRRQQSTARAYFGSCPVLRPPRGVACSPPDGPRFPLAQRSTTSTCGRTRPTARGRGPMDRAIGLPVRPASVDMPNRRRCWIGRAVTHVLTLALTARPSGGRGTVRTVASNATLSPFPAVTKAVEGDDRPCRRGGHHGVPGLILGDGGTGSTTPSGIHLWSGATGPIHARRERRTRSLGNVRHTRQSSWCRAIAPLHLCTRPAGRPDGNENWPTRRIPTLPPAFHGAPDSSSTSRSR